MLVIVGLGNPGKSYAETRHNVGFRALDILSKEFGTGDWSLKQKFRAEVQEGRIVTAPILLVKPQSFMNRSGEPIRKIVDFYKLNPAEQLLVIFDDVDLPLGSLRLRMKGGPGTHNGMKSIVETLGEEFPRLRIGVGTPTAGGDLATWILSVPSAEEKKVIAGTLKQIPDLVKKYVLHEAKGATGSD